MENDGCQCPGCRARREYEENCAADWEQVGRELNNWDECDEANYEPSPEREHPELVKFGGFWPSDEALDPGNDSSSRFSRLGVAWLEEKYSAPSRGEYDAQADRIAASAAQLGR